MSQEISDIIRAAINSSGKPLSTIAKKAGIDVSSLGEFMDGADLHLTSASKIAGYLGLELTSSMKPANVQKAKIEKRRPPTESPTRAKTLKPSVRLVEEQAIRAYFRRYGEHAQEPNRKATKVFQQDGKNYIRLSNANGPLATYRVTQKTAGGWSLSYVDEKHEREIQ